MASEAVIKAIEERDDQRLKATLARDFDTVESLMGATMRYVHGSGADEVGFATATLNGTLYATGSVFEVWAYWGRWDGRTDEEEWTFAARVGTFTNVEAAIAFPVAGLLCQANGRPGSIEGGPMVAAVPLVVCPAQGYVDLVYPLLHGAAAVQGRGQWFQRCQIVAPFLRPA